MGAATDETERVRRIWEKEAPRYDRGIRLAERLLFGDGRAWICSRASGDVLEVGVGTGRNLPFYPDGVRLMGIDLSPAMLAIARERARRLGPAADLREGDAQALSFPDQSFDSVVCTLALCSIPDDRRAIAEMKRVLRPGGRLLLLEHVAGSSPVIRALQWALERLSLRFQGDYLLRRPVRHLQAEGFAIEVDQRSKWGIVERLVARKPA